MTVRRKIVPFLCALLLLSGCGAETPVAEASRTGGENSIEFFAMDTYMSIRAYGADDTLLENAAALVEALEAELSTTEETSAIYTLNHTGNAALSEETAYLVRRTLALCKETGGALDLSIYPVVRAWGFTTADEAYRVPGQDELDALLRGVDYTRVSLDGGNVSLEDGMEIDLGAVTKGYTGDRLAGLLRDAGVESALLDLGGNIQTVGAKPDGSDWRVAIQDPEGNGILGVIPTADKAVVTSGGYERYFIDDEDNLWWHIMDPATGYPARNGLISVSIVGDEGLYCDAISTALFIMGQERAIRFWQEHRDFEMALVTDGGELLLTPALAEVFMPAGGLSYAIEVIGGA